MISWEDHYLKLKPMITQRYIKRNYYFLLILLLFASCDLGGDVFLTNGYKDTIKIISQCDNKGKIIESSDILRDGTVFAFDTRRPEYRNIISIKVETLDGVQITEYSPEYLIKLRRAYNITAKQQESWIFTEKGLFIGTFEVDKRYKHDSKKIMDYYRSDEAVNELESRLLKAAQN